MYEDLKQEDDETVRRHQELNHKLNHRTEHPSNWVACHGWTLPEQKLTTCGRVYEATADSYTNKEVSVCCRPIDRIDQGEPRARRKVVRGKWYQRLTTDNLIMTV